MRIIISDSSCLIDLHKGGLLEAIFALPFTFVIPQPLWDEELLSINDDEKRELKRLGIRVEILPGEQVSKASVYFNEHRKLKLNDCFALVLAEETENAILFTGDQPLRTLAETNDIEAHGVLWAIDHLIEVEEIENQLLLQALELFRDDEYVRLPHDELKSRINRIRKLLR